MTSETCQRITPLGTLFRWSEVSAGSSSDSSHPLGRFGRLAVGSFNSQPRSKERTCPLCRGAFTWKRTWTDPVNPTGWIHNSSSKDWVTCTRCGWFAAIEESASGGFLVNLWTVGVLRAFESELAEEAMAEASSYLRRRMSDPYSLDWRQFEKLVGEVFLRMGYGILVTQQSKDGGADIILFGDGSEIAGIVECKKFAKERKVGLSLVRQLAGAALSFRTRTAFLITTSDFTSPAVEAGRLYRGLGFEITMKSASSLLDELGVRNRNYDSLENLAVGNYQD